MSSPASPDPSRRPGWVLRRADQLGVALLVLAGLVSLVGYWISQGALRGRVIEIERAPQQSAQFAVDINQAEWPELAELPGVGPTLARRIVDSRQTQGPYLDHEDLRRVRGIGPATLERMRPYLLPMAESSNVAGS